MMPKEPMRGATLFSHANKMTQAYHIMLTPLCKETGLPPLAMDILLFLANNPEHNTAKDICRMRGHKSGIVSVHVERLVNDGLLERREMPGDRRQTRLICTEQAQALIERGRQVQWQFGPVTVNSRLSYTYQEAQDRTDPASEWYGGQIPYIPWHSGSVVVRPPSTRS